MDDFGLDDLLGGLPDMAGFSTLVACDDNHDESINNNMALDLDDLDELPELRNMPMLSSEPTNSADKHASPAPSSSSQAKKIKMDPAEFDQGDRRKFEEAMAQQRHRVAVERLQHQADEMKRKAPYRQSQPLRQSVPRAQSNPDSFLNTADFGETKKRYRLQLPEGRGLELIAEVANDLYAKSQMQSAGLLFSCEASKKDPEKCLKIMLGRNSCSEGASTAVNLRVRLENADQSVVYFVRHGGCLVCFHKAFKAFYKELESTYGVREALFIGVADRKRSASVGSQLEGSPHRTPRGVSELDNLKISEPLGRDGCGRDCCGDVCATQ